MDKPQCSVSTVGTRALWSLPLGALKPSSLLVVPNGNSSTNAPVMAKGRNHASPLGRSPNPLPINTPGRIELGSSAPTACAPECPMPQSNPVETSISCSLFRYISLLMPTSVVAKPEVLAIGQLRCIQPLSTSTCRKGVSKRVNDQ